MLQFRAVSFALYGTEEWYRQVRSGACCLSRGLELGGQAWCMQIREKAVKHMRCNLHQLICFSGGLFSEPK